MDNFEQFKQDIDKQLEVDFLDAVYPELIFENNVYTKQADKKLFNKSKQYTLSYQEEGLLYLKMYNKKIYTKRVYDKFDWQE